MMPDELVAQINATLTTLKRAKFKPDPLIGSDLVSVWSSAQKRHGVIIEAAIRSALRQGGYEVWSESAYLVAPAVDMVVDAQKDPQKIVQTRMPYGDRGRSMQIDVIAYSPDRRMLGAYEIKRGNGNHDAKAIRFMRRDVFGVAMTLEAYGVGRGLTVEQTLSRLVAYYGVVELPPPWGLTGAQLDEHFGCPVRVLVEEATQYYKSQVQTLVQQRGGHQLEMIYGLTFAAHPGTHLLTPKTTAA